MSVPPVIVTRSEKLASAATQAYPLLLVASADESTRGECHKWPTPWHRFVDAAVNADDFRRCAVVACNRAQLPESVMPALASSAAWAGTAIVARERGRRPTQGHFRAVMRNLARKSRRLSPAYLRV